MPLTIAKLCYLKSVNLLHVHGLYFDIFEHGLAVARLGDLEGEKCWAKGLVLKYCDA